jgi:uncharacterized RDD family membrane protein YckC
MLRMLFTRASARALDLMLVYFLARAIVQSWFPHLGFTAAAHRTHFYQLLLWMPLEAFFVALLGTTPGKALCNIKIRDEFHRKPPFPLACLRAVSVAVEAFGLAIPPFYPLLAFRSSHQLRTLGRTSYDARLDIQILQGPVRPWRLITVLAILFAIPFLAVS